MNRFKRLAAILAGATLIISTSVYAQDIHFSQFYETSVLRNPSLTGIFTGDYKVGVIYRSQWNSISKPFQTALVNAETRIAIGGSDVPDYLSIGLLSYYDKAGSIDMKTMTFYPAINYNKSLEDAHNSYLSVGFTGGYVQRSFDPSKATFNNQYQNNSFSPDNPTGEQLPTPKFNYWDLGAGLTYSGNAGTEDKPSTFFIGLGGYHLTLPKNSFYGNTGIRLGMRWNVNAGFSTQLNEHYSLLVHANYMKQGNYNEVIVGPLIGWNKKDFTSGGVMFVLYAGVFYRLNDAIIPTIKLRYKDVAFICSYDSNISTLKAATNLRGGYEISIIKTGLLNGPEHEKSRTLCPEFY